MTNGSTVTARAGWVLMMLVVAVGCQPHGPIVPAGFMPPAIDTRGPVPGYTELAEAYNAHMAELDRVWSATDVEIRWRDDGGDAHFERGEGKFLFVRPSRVALTVEKLGKTYLWAGSDDQRFWLFDNQAHVAYVGEHVNVGKACAQPLPLPVHPSAVPYLLGLMPIDAGLGRVMRVRGHYLVEPAGTNLALWLHPQTLRPVRVDLTDDAGRSAVRAILSDYQPVEQAGAPREQWPLMPTHAELYIQGREARMTLDLSRLTDGVADHRIRDAAFDFETLVRAHDPDAVVELDGDCE